MTNSRFSQLAGLPPMPEWPTVDFDCLRNEAGNVARRRYAAIKMYVDGIPHSQIKKTTGIPRAEVHRLLNRCCAVAGDGRIFGMRALVPGVRVKSYNRSSDVNCIPGGLNQGCAGALEQLFQRFPQLRREVHAAFLQITPRRKGGDARIRICDLHAKFIRWLEDHGHKKTEWPLNTANEGLESLRRYCNSLLDDDPAKWIRARSGKEAGRRLTVGRGITPVLPNLRPYGAVQLDFHKVDSACVIHLTNPFGCDVCMPLARWHIGVLLEERFEMILGAVLALELTPSADSVLETIECSLEPVLQSASSCALAIGVGGQVFPNQLFATLRGQCFSVLRMDNGWSNTARDVIDNVIDTVGCAIQFGPVRAWWGRDTIERVFGQMTRGGLQRSHSTFGNGPLDTRKDAPQERAVELDIRLSDLASAIEHAITVHNASRTGALLMGSPIGALQAATENPESGFIPTPLPKNTSELPLLMYHIEIATVRGSVEKGERPYVKLGGWRYTNDRLASDFGLLGKHLRLYCSRRDVRLVHASVVETGEVLGRLKVPNRWGDIYIDWRTRTLIQRAGVVARRQNRRDLRADEWLMEVGDTPDLPRTGRLGRMGKRALEAANRVVKRQENCLPIALKKAVTFTQAVPSESIPTGDEFHSISLDSKVNIEQVYQGEPSWPNKKR